MEIDHIKKLNDIKKALIEARYAITPGKGEEPHNVVIYQIVKLIEVIKDLK